MHLVPEDWSMFLVQMPMPYLAITTKPHDLVAIWFVWVSKFVPFIHSQVKLAC